MDERTRWRIRFYKHNVKMIFRLMWHFIWVEARIITLAILTGLSLGAGFKFYTDGQVMLGALMFVLATIVSYSLLKNLVRKTC
jgi:hypothetical protein